MKAIIGRMHICVCVCSKIRLPEDFYNTNKRHQPTEKEALQIPSKINNC